jgi:threonine dehydrogenase-like Zn-dependent dehydrogenase
MQIASLGEPVGYAMFSVLTCGVNLGDTAVVLGTGFAGLIMVQGLKKKSAYKVIAVDKSANKLALARQLGADVTLQMGKVVQAIITGTEEFPDKPILEIIMWSPITKHKNRLPNRIKG